MDEPPTNKTQNKKPNNPKGWSLDLTCFSVLLLLDWERMRKAYVLIFESTFLFAALARPKPEMNPTPDWSAVTKGGVAFGEPLGVGPVTRRRPGRDQGRRDLRSLSPTPRGARGMARATGLTRACTAPVEASTADHPRAETRRGPGRRKGGRPRERGGDGRGPRLSARARCSRHGILITRRSFRATRGGGRRGAPWLGLAIHRGPLLRWLWEIFYDFNG